MIGYYVHHHGRGHLARARCIAAELPAPVTVLSSLPRPDDLEPFAGWVTLPPDDADGGRTDVNGGGALHWAPLRSPGYRFRMAAIGAWAELASPPVVVVDVSVEVTAFVRLLGIPVVVMAGPGERTDEVHQLGYRLATHLIAPWPRDIYQPDYLRPYSDKLTQVGAISRFDCLPRSAAPGQRRVLALFGGGGGDIHPGDLAAARAATPDWLWQGFGGDHLPWIGQVWDQLQAADVVVSHAGQNVIAEIAAARRPAILVAQARPFGEQRATASALHTAGIARQLGSWPPSDQWPSLLAEALTMGGEGWSHWNAGDGAANAAEVIMQVAVAA